MPFFLNLGFSQFSVYLANVVLIILWAQAKSVQKFGPFKKYKFRQYPKNFAKKRNQKNNLKTAEHSIRKVYIAILQIVGFSILSDDNIR